MSSDRESEALFAVDDYTAWCRALYRRMPFPEKAYVLFESTIAEPTALLSDLLREMFAEAGVSDRFQSVFGRGNRHLVDALAARYRVGADCIVTTTGAGNAIAMTLRALVGEPDGKPSGHVLIENPHLDLLRHLAAAAGASISTLERRGLGFEIDPDEVARALRADTRLVVLTNPHNPSGAVLSAGALAAIAAAAARIGAFVLVDEVYADFVDDLRASPAARLAPNIISVSSVTKVYGLFSLRCGWLIAEPRLARRIEEANARTEFGVSKLTHAIAAHVIENPAPFEAHWRCLLKRNRPIVENAVAAMRAEGLIEGDMPAFGCVYFPRIVGCTDTRGLAQRLWSGHGLIVAPGEFFGRAGHIRLGFGLEGGFLEEGLARLHHALRSEVRAPREHRAPRRASS